MGTSKISGRELKQIKPDSESDPRQGRGTKLSDSITCQPNLHQEPAAPATPKRSQRSSTKSATLKPALTSNRDEVNFPELERRRSRRHQGHQSLVYNARYHPADDVLRPYQAAKLKAKKGAEVDVEGEDTADESDSHVSSGVGNGVFNESQEANSGTTENDDENVLPSSSPIPSPNRRRSSRNSGRAQGPNYDTRYHPSFDTILRPSTAKAALMRKSTGHRSRRSSTQSESSSTSLADNSTNEIMERDMQTDRWQQETVTLTFSPILYLEIPPLLKPNLRSIQETASTPPKSPQSADANASATFSVSNRVGDMVDDVFCSGFHPNATPEIPASKPITTLASVTKRNLLDFNHLHPLERRLYLLQNGVSASGSILPRTWPEVKQALFEDRHITRDELMSDEATQVVKRLYETLRLGIEGFFDSQPEPADKRDWTVRYMEDFDVFDKKSGSKYWRHYHDSIMKPTSIEVGPAQPHDIADNEAGVHSHSASTTTEESYDKHETRSPVSSVRNNSDIMGPVNSATGSKEPISTPGGFLTNHEEGPTNLMEYCLGDYARFEPNHESDPIDKPAAESVTQSLQFGQPLQFSDAFQFQPQDSSGMGDDCIDPRSLQQQDPSVLPRVKRRKIRADPEIIVHEDSPNRVAAMELPESPRSDIPKENFDEADAFLNDLSDFRSRTPRDPRRRVVYASPRSAYRRSTNITPSWGMTPMGSLHTAFLGT